MSQKWSCQCNDPFLIFQINLTLLVWLVSESPWGNERLYLQTPDYVVLYNLWKTVFLFNLGIPSTFSLKAGIADSLLVLYSSPSENKFNETSNTKFTPADTGSIFLERQQLPNFCHPILQWCRMPGLGLLPSKSIFWSDNTSVECCCRCWYWELPYR